jgi:SAM-dependent methyltransferase
VINDKVEPNSQYYSELRPPMLSLVKGTPQRVLEIGCASGQTLAYLKEHGATYTVGIEYSSEVAESARNRGLDQVIAGNVETLDLQFEPNSFDLIIAGHVLEHLANPWTTLHKLIGYLRNDGQFVGALPNVRHHSIIFPLLLHGKWQYEPSGVMDWTHLRFFSRQTVFQLLESTGFRVEEIAPEFHHKSGFANSLSLGLFQDLLCFAYNFRAVPADRPAL